MVFGFPRVPLCTSRKKVAYILSSCNQLNHRPPGLEVIGQDQFFMRVLNANNLLFRHCGNLLFTPSALTSRLSFLISKPFHPYLSARSPQLRQPSKKQRMHRVRKRIAELRYQRETGTPEIPFIRPKQARNYSGLLSRFPRAFDLPVPFSLFINPSPLSVSYASNHIHTRPWITPNPLSNLH